MTRRTLAAVTYVLAGAVAALDPTYLGLGLVASSAVLLTLGYRYRGDFTLVASGWLLYLPLAAALLPISGPFWSYLVSGSILALLTERLSFENQSAYVMEAPKGVDAESRRLAQSLSRAHLRRLALVASAAAAVCVLSSAASFLLSAVTALILGSVVLLVAIAFYAWRATRTPAPELAGKTPEA